MAAVPLSPLEERLLNAVPEVGRINRDALLAHCGLRLQEAIPAMANLVEHRLLVAWQEGEHRWYRRTTATERCVPDTVEYDDAFDRGTK